MRPAKPLKIRALEVCLQEALNHGAEIFPGDQDFHGWSRPVPTERVAHYFLGATRFKEGQERDVGTWASNRHLKSDEDPSAYLDFCQAAQGWAERVASFRGEELPPHRLGSFSEGWQKDGALGKRGKVIHIDVVRAGLAYPTPGALAYFSRGRGRGHVERVIMPGKEAYWSVGANEGSRPGKWHLEWRSYDDLQLVGFTDCDPLPDTPEAWTIPALGELRRMSGIDVSHHQDPDDLDWIQLEDDHDFAIFRGTYFSSRAGAPVLDRAFERNWDESSQTGMARGIYSWLDQDEHLQLQIDAMADLVERVYSGDLSRLIRPVIDVEPRPGHHLNAEWWRAALVRLIDALEPMGLPIIYGNRPDLEALGEGPWRRCPLWVAHYTKSPAPTLPEWGGDPGDFDAFRLWSLWQYRADPFPTVPMGTTRGYAGGTKPIDLNLARVLPMADGGYLYPGVTS